MRSLDGVFSFANICELFGVGAERMCTRLADKTGDAARQARLFLKS